MVRQRSLGSGGFLCLDLSWLKVKNTNVLLNTPSGSVDIVTFELLGLEFQAISAGPLLNSIRRFRSWSLWIRRKMLTRYGKSSPGAGRCSWQLGPYPHSERYGWLQDRYGLSWQINYSGGEQPRQKIVPVVMFVGGVCGQAEQAVKSWASVFPESSVANIVHYGDGEAPDRAGTLKYASFSLFGQEFGAMDSAHEHPFSFNEAISLIVNCETQKEIDSYWEKLSAVPEAEQCGWLKDKYGFSWQVVPADMDEMMRGDDQDRIDRVTQAMLVMKKLDMAKLWAAYKG